MKKSTFVISLLAIAIFIGALFFIRSERNDYNGGYNYNDYDYGYDYDNDDDGYTTTKKYNSSSSKNKSEHDIGYISYSYAKEGETVNPKVTTIVQSGTVGVSDNEGCGRLFDFDLSKKWCVEFTDSAYVIWKLSEPVKPKGYVMVTGEDCERFTGRNPRSWTLYGSQSSAPSRYDSSWEVLSVVENDTILQDLNNELYYYGIENCRKEYKFYKLEINAIHWGSIMQLTEFNLDFDGANTVYTGGKFNSDKIFIGSTYIIGDIPYSLRVGDTLTFYNARQPTSTYYAYSWDVTGGDGAISVSHSGDATCVITGVEEGTVEFEASLFYTPYIGAEQESYVHKVTITVLPASAEMRTYDNAPGKTCARCKGTKETGCPACYGDGKLYGGSTCSGCDKGKVPCYSCGGTGSRG